MLAGGSRLKALAVNLSQPSSQYGWYAIASFIGSNARRFKKS